eukprot:m.117654 g.117654  ORF g.117654 m.117654 type:complete len:1015 (-) comp9521_c0_seq2:143-3187(-)
MRGIAGASGSEVSLSAPSGRTSVGDERLNIAQGRMVAKSIEQFVQGSDAALGPIAAALQSGQVGYVEIVEALGGSLTSPDGPVRSRGVALLAALFHQIPLPPQQVEMFAAFFCDRLKDFGSVKHVLDALCCMAELPGIEPFVEGIIRSVFAEVNVQALAQSSRLLALRMMDTFIRRFTAMLQPMCNDLLFGLIQQIDGEKDPRCLMIVFGLVSFVVRAFNIERFTEELFEVTSCYFPITFTPPKDDQIGITKEDLVLGLRGCLTSTPAFAPFLFELLEEKLDSSVIDTKIESFRTIAAMRDVYQQDVLADNAGRLYVAARKELLLHSGSATAAIESISSLASIMSQDINHASAAVFFDQLLDEAVRSLSDLDAVFIDLHGQILGAAARGSSAACCHIWASQYPCKALAKFEEDTATAMREGVLAALVHLLQGTSIVSQTGGHPVLDTDTRGRIHSLLIELLRNNSTKMRTLAITGLSAMVAAKLASAPEMVLIARSLHSALLVEEHSETRKELLDASIFLAGSHSALAINQLVLPLRQNIDAPPENAIITPVGMVQCLGSLSVNSAIFQISLPIFLAIIADAKSSEELIAAAATTMLDVVKAQYKSHASELAELLVAPLLRVTVAHALDHPGHFAISPRALTIYSECLARIVASLPGDQNGLIGQSLEAMRTGSLKALNVRDSDCLEFDAFQEPHMVALGPFVAVIGSARREQYSELSTTRNLLDHALTVARTSEDEYAQRAASKLFAVFLNQYEDTPELTELVESLAADLEREMVSEIAGDARRRVAMAFGWMTKALLVRSHPLRKHCVEVLIRLLSDVTLGATLADCFHVLLCDVEDVLNFASHARFQLMYKQRFFMENIKLLVDGFHNASTECKAHYLGSVGHILRAIPKEVLLSELPPLLPLLLKSLELDNASLLVSTIDTLYTLVFDAPELMWPLLEDLVPTLLSLISHQSMKVRSSALQCLGVISTLPRDKILPFQLKITKALVPVLDDRKRVVRRDAVQCRSEWLML